MLAAFVAVLALAAGSARAAEDGATGGNPAPAPGTDAAGSGALLYFFSPDWRPPDFGKLTVAVEAALGPTEGPLAFQAFTRYEDFKKQVLVKPPIFMLAPSWLEDPANNDLGLALRVVARPQRRGKTSYRKAVMTRPGVDSLEDLARGTVAATLYSMGPGSTSSVLDTFHLAGDAARVVAVPKDVDALLALNFGQVDAALVTSEQYDIFARSSPSEASRLRVLAFSHEIPLPPVFACGDTDDATSRHLAATLVALASWQPGRDLLAMLGFDGFVAEPDPRQAADSAAKPAAAAPGGAKTVTSPVTKPAAHSPKQPRAAH